MKKEEKSSTFGRSVLCLDKFRLGISDSDAHVSNVAPVWVDVEFYYEPFLPATEDEPSCPEYIEIHEVILSENSHFKTPSNSISVTIAAKVNLLEMMYEYQYDEIVEAVSQMIHTKDKYSDPDTTRPPVSNRIKQELSFNLQEPYERD